MLPVQARAEAKICRLKQLRNYMYWTTVATKQKELFNFTLKTGSDIVFLYQ